MLHLQNDNMNFFSGCVFTIPDIINIYILRIPNKKIHCDKFVYCIKVYKCENKVGLKECHVLFDLEI